MSSLKDLASLIMVPSLYKDGRLDTVKPLGNGILHPDSTGNNDGTDGSTPAEGNFTFSRGSNLAATRVDVNGLIEKGRENLLNYSNDFSQSAWVNTDVNATGGQVGYDGSNDAWLITKTAGSFARNAQGVTTSGVQSFSVYAKANTLTWIRLLGIGSANNPYAYYDLSNGVLGMVHSSAIDANIVSVGNGWYRCDLTFSDTLSEVRIYPATGDGDLSTTGTIYIQDSQLESGLVATPYIETGTSAAQSGILEDMPRLDYSGGASCPSLLLEPQRTNQVQNSEYYELYALNSVSISSNATTSPEGLQNATELIEDSSNDNHFFRIPNLSWTSGTDAVFTIYLKENTRRYARLRFDNTGGNTRVWVDLRTGETTFIDATDSAVCTSVDVGNGWYRYEFKVTPSNTGTGSVQVFTQSVESVTGSLQTVYQGDGTSGIYVWGAQLETGSYPTSYIPTYGVSQTRAQDATTITDLQGKGVYPSLSEGTFFLDLEVNGRRDAAGSYRHIRLVNNSDSTSNRIRIFEGNNGVISYIRADLTGGVVEQGFSADTQNKLAVTWGSEGTKIYKNGELAQSTAIQLSFTSTQKVLTNVLSNYNFNQVLMFPTALTDSECIALTTL